MKSGTDKVFEKLKEYKVKKQSYLYRIWTCTLVAILVVNVISFVGGGFFYSKRIITFGFVYVIYSYGNMLKSPLENMQNYIQSYMMAKESIGRMFILAEMYRRSGGTDTAVPVEVYRQTGTGYRLHHSG